MDYKNALKVMCKNIITIMTAYNKLKHGTIQEWEFFQVLELCYRDADNTLNYLRQE